MAQGMTKQHLRIGAGAGFAGDRWEPAVELVERGEIDVIAFECLAERTIARETLALRRGDGPGYSPKLEARLGAVLPACAAKGIRVVTNMGAAAPLAAGRAACAVAAELGIADFRCAVLLGDDVRDVLVARPELSLLETGEPLESILPRMASANAYLGADAVAEALASGALAVITGRVADPSLFVGPMLHAFGWSYDDYAKLAQATAAGHLLECAGQVTGGYFADPGINDVPALARLGFPFADVSAAGEVVIGKLAEAGGRVDARTCSEQLLYEIDDPAAYITPDCVLDMGGIGFTEIARDRIRVEGARARPRARDRGPTSTLRRPLRIGGAAGHVATWRALHKPGVATPIGLHLFAGRRSRSRRTPRLCGPPYIGRGVTLVRTKLSSRRNWIDVRCWVFSG